MSYGVTVMAGSCVVLVMENVITSLSRLIDDIGDQLSLRERLDIAVGCVSAVDYLHHQLGVGHGMLTCEYVFVSSTLTAKILDPTAVVLINGQDSLTSHGSQDDILQLGRLLLALFRGVVLDIESDLWDDSGQCSELHNLCNVLRLMVDFKGIGAPSSDELLSSLEGVRQTDLYRQCPPKRDLRCSV